MVGRMDIFRGCCDPLPPIYCCGEAVAPGTMTLQMANWSTAHRPGVPYVGNPWTSEDEVTIDLTPLNGTHILEADYPIANYNVLGTLYNSQPCRWGKVVTIPVTWINRISLASRTDNIVVLVELRDAGFVSSRVSSIHLSVLYPTSEDVTGTWYETRWLADQIVFEVQGLSRLTTYVYPNFSLSFDISQTTAHATKCSEYDLEYPDYTVDLSANLTLASDPTFAVVAP